VKFETLALAALGWVLLNAAGGARVRPRLVARFGEKRCDSALSFAKMAALWWLVREYGRAPYVPLWHASAALKLAPVVLVPPAFMLLAKALIASESDQVVSPGAEPVTGFRRVISQPLSSAVALWACSHEIVSGDVGSQLFFGTLVLTALHGMRGLPHRLPGTELLPERSDAPRQAQNAPDSAAKSRHFRSRFRELWLPVLLGLGLSIVAAALHEKVFGMPALPKNADTGQQGANFVEGASRARNFLYA
jgi:uncharacterized membrane protein